MDGIIYIAVIAGIFSLLLVCSDGLVDLAYRYASCVRNYIDNLPDFEDDGSDA